MLPRSFYIAGCFSLTLSFTHCPGLAKCPAGHALMEALLTSASFRRPCRPVPQLQHLSHPPDQPISHSARGTAEPRAHLTINHQSLIVIHLECCLQCRPQSLNNNNSFIKFSQRSLGWPEVSDLALFSLAIVQVGHGGTGLF